MDSVNKKKLKDAYKTKAVIGGVCCIRCSGNGRVFLQSTRNLEGLKNRYNFAIATQGSPDPSMRSEWEKYGSQSFSFSVLEELKKGETQTDKEFADDIALLYEIWLERLEKGDL